MQRYRSVARFSITALIVGSCFAVGLFLFQGAVVSAQQPVRDPAQTLSTNVPDGFTVASVGDIILNHPATETPENKPIAAILRAADMAMGNFEGAIVDYHRYKVPQNIISHYWALDGEPSVAKDLKEMGIRMVGRANNHQSDWGMDGARETDHWLDEAGIVHAGDGETRDLAREARFYDSPKGRIGLISLTSSISDPQQIAINANGKVPARPGLNPLRVIRFSNVTAEQMDALRKIHDAYHYGAEAGLNQKVAATSLSAPVFHFPVQLASDELYLFGTFYKIGDKPGFSYKMNPLDEREILQSVRDAKQNCDFLIVTIHAHESPADFLSKISKEAIDAGADEWVGTGPHHMLGVEIYKKRPIFHSLGDLFFEINLASQPASQEEFEDSSDPAVTDDSVFAANFWSKLGPLPFIRARLLFRSSTRTSCLRFACIPSSWGGNGEMRIAALRELLPQRRRRQF